MKIILLSLLIVSLNNCLIAQNSFTENYPLNIGNVFVFGWSSYGGGHSSSGIKKAYITGDTVVNGSKYYKYVDNTEITFYRIDTFSGKLMIYKTGFCTNSVEYMQDSLWSDVNQSSYRCTGNRIQCTQVGEMTIFGNTLPMKTFTEISFIGSGIITTVRKYVKGFGRIYYSSSYSGGGGGGGGRTDNLRGCIINGILYGDTSSVVTTIANSGNEGPLIFQLYQNYPNPFNPQTNIKYDIPKMSNVKISIYDLLGKEISVLVNEEMNAGTFEVNWDASNYPSGVYLYKIETEEFSESKKMVLIK